MRTAFIETLLELADEDPRICLLTGDLGFTVLERFAEKHPSRFYNVGVAESNMIGLATGLAASGAIPFAYSIATFASMRGYDAWRNGAVLHRLPVRLVGIGGGFAYGHAGITHYALEDLAIMRAQPGVGVIAPADPLQTRAALRATYASEGPIYYRIGKGGDPVIPGLEGKFSADGVETVGDGGDVLLLATGGITSGAVEASALLSKKGISVTVGVAAALNPPPRVAMARLMRRFRRILTVEEHYLHGGLGSLAAEILAGMKHPVDFALLGVPSLPTGITGSAAFMRRRAGLDPAAIAERAAAFVRESGG